MNLQVLSMKPRIKTGKVVCPEQCHWTNPTELQEFSRPPFISLSNGSITDLSSSFQIPQQCRNLSTLVLTLNFHGKAPPDDHALHSEKFKAITMENWVNTAVVDQQLRIAGGGYVMEPLEWNYSFMVVLKIYFD
ncbi:hypothetical protein OIU74_017915 [Salix koriyanagi]|uniref:Uncharacterized protein n=1 Tax=Salix koriyanagi TaxID=2511006 RepID=A0A9Q1AHM0_9ROSI|nr:hypothetical protein OIU74_017915 [Salix koriyanagi]